MKILIFSDVHWSEKSSITNKFGLKYTQRLEMLLNSMNWVNEVAVKENCTTMICAGDMFDKSSCTDMELTALKDIKWNNLPCYFLCGNHESSTSDLRFNTVKSLEANNHYIVTEPMIWKYNNDENEICFLPYVVESDRKPLFEYFGKNLGKRLIISHNDIAGINYGPIVSKTGFNIDEIKDCCTLFLNGHLHNSEFIGKNILNLGSLSAHNFTNDSTAYKYGCWIIDTDTLKLEFIENPYAFNFYKLEVSSEDDFSCFNKLKPNSVVSIKCNIKFIDGVKTLIAANKNIIETRLIISKDMAIDTAGIDMPSFSVDHIAKFIECARSHYGTDEILEAELAEICK